MILMFQLAIEIAKLQGSIGNTYLPFSLSLQRTGMRTATLLVIGSMAIGLFPLSPMLIQSAKTGTTAAIQKCFGWPPTIVGTDNDDLIQGTVGDDIIVGLRGNDQIFGKVGNDSIFGGDGNDIILSGGAGDDLLYGEKGMTS
jgi:Ca2+-binding RTX toxin-like protein